MRTPLPLLFLALIACGDKDSDDSGDTGPAEVVYPDADGDGFTSDQDCDDDDPTVYPGAEEYCDDIDGDCDGIPDLNEPAVDALDWYADYDGDGYGDPENARTNCYQPSNFIPADDENTDCDDDDAAINPEGYEDCDGVDNDCDGLVDSDDPDCDLSTGTTFYGDADGDGYPAIDNTTIACDQPKGWYTADEGDELGADCNDDDATIHPNAEEICGDLIDNNCDGGANHCGLEGDVSLTDAMGRLLGEVEDQNAGTSVDGPGDIDGDGYADLIVGASDGDSGGPGAVWRVYGPVSGDVSLAKESVRFGGDNDGDEFGSWAVGLSDVNGDGHGELLVGAPGVSTSAGAVYLFQGPLLGGGSASDADVVWYGDSAYARLGNSVDDAGDVNGDGYADLLMGGGFTNAAWLVYGPATSYQTDVEFQGVTGADYAGDSVLGAGDLNGDGFDDVVIGAWQYSFVTAQSGAAHVLYGPLSGTIGLHLSDVTLQGEAEADYAGKALANAGDVDGDGNPDLLVGAYENDEGANDGGAAYLILSSQLASWSGEVSLEDAHVKMIAEDNFDYAGYRVAGAGDTNADGQLDLMVGAWKSDAGGYDTGTTYLYWGPVTGTLELGEADARFFGEANSDASGVSLAGPGDVNGDGYDDAFIGANQSDAAATDAGAAFILRGGPGL